MKRRLALIMLLLGFASATAFADTISLSLNNPVQYVNGKTGGTLTYNATASAPAGNGADVYLNGDSFNVATPVSLDDTDFFVNYPFTLSPGDSFTGDLFTLTVPGGTPFGTYFGSFTLLGGADGNAGDTLDTVNYSVTVTPEPSSFLLLGSGLTGAFTFFRKRRSSTV